MIRKLKSSDYKNVMKYLSGEAALNLFIIGDIENFGFESDVQTLWAEFINNEIKSVLLYYSPAKSCIYYSKDIREVSVYVEVMKDLDFTMISGKEDLINPFKKYFEFTSDRNSYFAELKQLMYKSNYTNSEIKILSTSHDEIGKLHKLLNSIEEFQNITTIEEDFIKNKIRTIETGSGRTYYIEENDNIVSSAATTAENSLSAMVVAVATDINYRYKGYASMILTKLCEDLLDEGKSLCLFYDNPKAGKIYHRLGFNDIGIWKMLKVK